MNFEEAIVKIANSISISREYREIYSKDFDKIRKYILDIMQSINPVFKKIYNGPSLFGSYLEHMKTHVPDEFDLHFLLKLPYNEYIKVRKFNSRPGYVSLSLSKCLKKMEADQNHFEVYTLFEEFVNDENYLMRNRVHDWLSEIISEGLSKYGNKVRSYDGKSVYKLKYFPRGTALTIKAFSESRKISIDFVPAFKFDANKDWFAERRFPHWVKEKLWFAVPKPSVGGKTGRKLTFSICVPQIEKDILINKYHLKPSLRLLKCLRDECDTRYRIKSYFIKTIYLYENDIRDDRFWRQPIGSLLIHMLDKLINCLHKKSITCYWCPSLNMLDSLDDDEIEDLEDNFLEARENLVRLSKQQFVSFKKMSLLFINKRPKDLKELFNKRPKDLKEEYIQ